MPSPSHLLRRAAVQVCRLDAAIVGTGVIVCSDPWLVVTCEHVAAAAGVPRSAPPDALLGVQFPEVKPPAFRNARVVGRLDEQDDMVVLCLDGPEPPVLPEHVVELVAAGNADDHRFKSYGFRSLDKYAGGIADGTIQGAIPPPVGYNLVCDPLQIRSDQITHGMSGAPVLDLDTGRLVAIVMETFFPDAGSPTKDPATAWAVDGGVIASFPVGVQCSRVTLPAVEGPAAGTPLAPREKPSQQLLHGAPVPADPFVNRDSELAWLTERYRDPEQHVLYVTGGAGVGTTALVRRWIEVVARDDSPPETAFWWGFGEFPSTDQFFSTALDHFSGGRAPASFKSGAGRPLALAAYVVGLRAVLVLDGPDALDDPDAAAELQSLLDVLAHAGGESTTVVTTLAAPSDGACVLNLGPLDADGAIELLEGRGVETEAARAIAEHVTNPLALELAGSDPKLEQVASDIAEAETEEAGLNTVLSASAGLLSADARHLLLVASLTRRPVRVEWRASLAAATEKVFGRPIKDVDGTVNELVISGMAAIVEGEGGPSLSVHDAARSLIAELGDRAAIHRALADMWWDHRFPGEAEPVRSAADLQPAIEAVHHLCAAGRYVEALERLFEGVYRHQEFTLVNQLGEWAVDLGIVREFFPGGDLAADPHLEDASQRAVVLNEAAQDLRMLGRPLESLSLFDRAARATEEPKSMVAIVAGISETRLEIGDIVEAEEAARTAIENARAITDDGEPLSYAHATLARPLALRGELDAALEQYALAREAHRYRPPDHAVQQAAVLWWAGRVDEARGLADQTLSAAQATGDREGSAAASRLLGELAVAAAPGNASAVERLRETAAVAAGLIAGQLRIEGLTAYGAALADVDRSNAGMPRPEDVLTEALRLTADSGWRFFEPPIRIALAHVAHHRGEQDVATVHLGRAERLATESGNAFDLARIARVREAPGEPFYPLAPAPIGARSRDES